jgi:hypothetical protein
MYSAATPTRLAFKENRKQMQKKEDESDLDDLSETIFSKTDIDMETIEYLEKGQNFTRDPRLALAYYHLCSSHPDAFVFNDKTLNNERDDDLFSRLENQLRHPIEQDDSIRCQECAAVHDRGTGRIAEVLIECDHTIVEIPGIENLPPEFTLDDDEVNTMKSIFEDFVKNN